MTGTVSELYGRRPPKAFKYKEEVPCVNPELIVGLELETENCPLDIESYENIGLPLGIDVKTDNSLRTVNGNAAYEFITKPTMTKNVLSTLDSFFQKTGFKEDNYSDRCSVHVHVNCCDMTFEQVAAVALIYTVVEQILFEFVNEKQGDKEGWSRDTNIYCVPWNQCRDHLNLVYNFTQSPLTALGRWQKYTALNLIPLTRLGTMEWRHMHGTADMTKITRWLNIIGAIYKHAKETPFEELIKDIQGLNTVSHYGKFFDTVLGGQLPYNDVYRQAMEEGCILAKYSMINWSLEKKTPGSVTAKKVVPPDWARNMRREDDELAAALDAVVEPNWNQIIEPPQAAPQPEQFANVRARIVPREPMWRMDPAQVQAAQPAAPQVADPRVTLRELQRRQDALILERRQRERMERIQRDMAAMAARNR